MTDPIETNLEEIGKYMSSPVLCIDSEANAQEAALEMHAMEVGCLLVKEDGDYIGIISDSDISRKVVAAGKTPEHVKVVEIMSKPVQSLDRYSFVEEAENFMRNNKIRHLAVSEEDRIVGILSVKDLVSCYSQTFRMTE